MADQEGTVVIGSGRGSKFRDSHPSNQKSKGQSGNQNQGGKGPKRGQRGPQTPPEIVRVHNGPNNPVGEISIRALVRFSRRARDQFPKPKPEGQQGPQTGKNEPSTQNPTAPAPNTAGSTGVLIPITAEVGGNSKGKGKAPAVPQHTTAGPSKVAAKQDRKPIYRTLVLGNEAELMPTNGEVQRALAWMKRNARARGKQSISSFGPADLKQADFERVVDAYQVALVFAIQPFPHHIRDELIQRIDREEPTLERMKMLNECVPLHDVVLQEMMEMHDRCYMMRGYSQAEVDAFNDYIFLPKNEAFAERLAYVGRVRKRARRAQKQEAANQQASTRQNSAMRGGSGRGRGGRAA